MNENSQVAGMTALVTGANSGVGFETAYRLAAAGWGKVILACRTVEKSNAARSLLRGRGAPDVFEMLAVDVSEVNSSSAAADELLSRRHTFDLVLLNAGVAGGSAIARNSDGVDLTFASTLTGHHVLAARLLNGAGIADQGRIIIAGSEAARGDVLGMTVPDFESLARAEFKGSVHELLKAFATGSTPRYVSTTAYAIAKLCAAWWAGELATRLPKGVAVYAVSPGNAPATNMGRDLPWPVRTFLLPTLSAVGPLVGMAHSIETASQRYLDASRFSAEDSGKFFASPAKKLTGPLSPQTTRWLDDVTLRAAAYRLVVELAGGIDVRVGSNRAGATSSRTGPSELHVG